MSAARVWTWASLSALLGLSLATGSGCGTDAQGIDDCRDIEKARCAAGAQCGIVTDVEACERFYRDQCLHGLAVKPPANSVVERCVGTIRAAGDCAATGVGALLSDCSTPVSANAPSLTRACDVVLRPEETEECAFLQPDPQPVDTPDSAAGSAGSSGASGAGGSDGSLDAGGLL